MKAPVIAMLYRLAIIAQKLDKVEVQGLQRQDSGAKDLIVLRNFGYRIGRYDDLPEVTDPGLPKQSGSKGNW